MKIGIVTQSLLNNYGGILQNFALQTVLKKTKCTPITIDFIPSRNLLRNCLIPFLKKNIFRKKMRKPLLERKGFINEFVEKEIAKTKIIHHYRDVLSLEFFDAVVVGSDQVWRKKYNNPFIEDMYLKFTKNLPIKRIAYAASFGVDDWEYTPRQTRKCSKLARKFDAISVREESGVRLCKEYFDVDATRVLDPTLLLTKEDYLPICKEVPVCDEKYLAVYVLDENEEIKAIYEKEASARGLVVKKFQADSESRLTVPEWLAMFRDASFVVTDSFHGTIFSIIFDKDFKCIYNRNRGAVRFESLLNIYRSGKLEMMRAFSLNWLKNALEA